MYAGPISQSTNTWVQMKTTTLKTREVGASEHKSDTAHHIKFHNTSILAKKSKTHEAAHHGSKHPNINWKDKFSLSMQWKPPIHSSKLMNTGDFITTCVGPKGPFSCNTYVKITK
jgi:hypothetical protein